MNNLPSSKEMILKVLKIIGYPEDREKFYEDFMKVCLEKSFVDFFSVVSEDRKKSLQKEFAVERTPKEIEEIIQTYVTPEEYFQTIQKNGQNLLLEYLKPIMPTLSKEQAQNLNDYFSSFTQFLNPQDNPPNPNIDSPNNLGTPAR